ncbi:hypothetical protein AVEN_14018-1 [Araneus ventricosus]|uniref:Uncharacterized protein n=1 Tax=Araneus ventricosus TaxID=182803 RepID=A0A4Y2N1I4_ARAVE|nr:hypothetical protein AVEN_14018-1 [Araneus ventricosus]
MRTSRSGDVLAEHSGVPLSYFRDNCNLVLDPIGDHFRMSTSPTRNGVSETFGGMMTLLSLEAGAEDVDSSAVLLSNLASEGTAGLEAKVEVSMAGGECGGADIIVQNYESAKNKSDHERGSKLQVEIH